MRWLLLAAAAMVASPAIAEKGGSALYAKRCRFAIVNALLAANAKVERIELLRVETLPKDPWLIDHFFEYTLSALGESAVYKVTCRYNEKQQSPIVYPAVLDR